MNEAPRPAAAELKRLLASELSTRSRVLLVLLLLLDLMVAVAVGSLWATEPGLPPRTHAAFALILVTAAAWAGFFGWTLGRRRVLLGRHRLIAARLAVTCTALFACGALLLASLFPELRAAGRAAAGLLALLLAVALWLLRRAAAHHAGLVARRIELERRLSGPASGMAPLFLVCAFLAGPQTASAQPVGPDALAVRVAGAPIAVAALGRQHVAYELHLTNFGLAPRRVTSLSVLDADTGAVVESWSGGELLSRLAPAGSADPGVVEPGFTTIAFAWAITPRGGMPSRIRHRVVTTGVDGQLPATVQTAPVAVGRLERSLAAAPVGPGTWVALRGPGNSSGHRRSVVTLDGAARVPQRFAVDWALLGKDGRLFRNAGARNEDWYGYGAPVRAARGGRIARVVDGVPDHAPLDPKAAQAFTARGSLLGNAVIVDEGDGRFSVYAHLKPGSISTVENEPIAAGAVFGAIGNSGHSLAPHLHYHVSDDADPLASDGLPFVLPAFRLVGRIESLAEAVAGQPWRPEDARPAREVRLEMPLENMVILLGE